MPKPLPNLLGLVLTKRANSQTKFYIAYGRAYSLVLTNFFYVECVYAIKHFKGNLVILVIQVVEVVGNLMKSRVVSAAEKERATVREREDNGEDNDTQDLYSDTDTNLIRTAQLAKFSQHNKAPQTPTVNKPTEPAPGTQTTERTAHRKTQRPNHKVEIKRGSTQQKYYRIKEIEPPTHPPLPADQKLLAGKRLTERYERHRARSPPRLKVTDSNLNADVRTPPPWKPQKNQGKATMNDPRIPETTSPPPPNLTAHGHHGPRNSIQGHNHPTSNNHATNQPTLTPTTPPLSTTIHAIPHTSPPHSLPQPPPGHPSIPSNTVFPTLPPTTPTTLAPPLEANNHQHHTLPKHPIRPVRLAAASSRSSWYSLLSYNQIPKCDPEITNPSPSQKIIRLCLEIGELKRRSYEHEAKKTQYEDRPIQKKKIRIHNNRPSTISQRPTPTKRPPQPPHTAPPPKQSRRNPVYRRNAPNPATHLLGPARHA
ncbi:proline-rich receptor-like protein kinase PERK10 [Penaeus chinensis]|uniref:proline-rich receptor-like protein kinase PERK10 n=1 Tax=Penaeus chinensis TaxID=139456 RepID=UPI001FB77F03|nr:proline-rich receptor-like protein kinase PERK10 [Penaeus chinensis]